MSLIEYKESIKSLIDSTTDELLLKYWKEQLEWDLQHQNELELSAEEWALIQEGIIDYENGNVLSLDEFISKRK
jgi:hypothetical protein